MIYNFLKQGHKQCNGIFYSIQYLRTNNICSTAETFSCRKFYIIVLISIFIQESWLQTVENCGSRRIQIPSLKNINYSVNCIQSHTKLYIYNDSILLYQTVKSSLMATKTSTSLRQLEFIHGLKRAILNILLFFYLHVGS